MSTRTEPDTAPAPGTDESSVGDAQMRATIVSVAVVGVCFAVAGLAFFDLRTGLGVLVGGALATANLVVFARVGQAFLARKGNTASWGLVAVLKLLLLFSGVWLILKSGLVSGLSLAAGYAALPCGITLASLFGPKPSEDVIKGGGAGHTHPPGDQDHRAEP